MLLLPLEQGLLPMERRLRPLELPALSLLTLLLWQWILLEECILVVQQFPEAGTLWALPKGQVCP